jgi:hypothetical protein
MLHYLKHHIVSAEPDAILDGLDKRNFLFGCTFATTYGRIRGRENMGLRSFDIGLHVFRGALACRQDSYSS